MAEVYFDYPINVPTLIIGLPLAVLMMLRIMEYEMTDIKENLILIVKCGLSWGIGCVTFWGTKWAIGSVLTGNNVFADAIMEMGRWTGQGEEVNTS